MSSPGQAAVAQAVAGTPQPMRPPAQNSGSMVPVVQGQPQMPRKFGDMHDGQYMSPQPQQFMPRVFGDMHKGEYMNPTYQPQFQAPLFGDMHGGQNMNPTYQRTLPPNYMPPAFAEGRRNQQQMPGFLPFPSQRRGLTGHY